MKMDTRSGRIAVKFVVWGVAIATVGLALCAEAVTYRVTADAAGGGDGSSWASAMTLDEALTATAGGGEILMKAGTYARTAVATFAPTAEVAIRGGYDGTDGDGFSAAARSTIDCANACDFLTLKNTAAVTFERIVFTRAKARAIVKTGVGDVTVRDCAFMGNGRSTAVNPGAAGRAIQFDGQNSSKAATAALTVTNTTFEGNAHNERGGGNGGAVYLSLCRRATFDDCAFVTNGTVYLASKTYGISAQYGSAFYASASPVTMRRCRFAGNCGPAAKSQGGEGGGCVYLTGAGGGSAFTNCIWIGNTEWLSHTPGSSPYGGALVVNLSAKAQAVDVQHCTFAHNLTCGGGSSGGLSVICGSVTVADSIFWQNVRGYVVSGGSGTDVKVQSNGYCTLRDSIVTGLDAEWISGSTASALSFDATVATNDPQLVTTDAEAKANRTTSNGTTIAKTGGAAVQAAFDGHLRSAGGRLAADGTWTQDAVTSAGIDRANRATAYAAEPTPNGGRANLGCYGNTAEASKTPTGQPAVASFAVAGADGTTRPEATLTFAAGADFVATVVFTCTTGGVVLATQTNECLHAGETVSWLVPAYLPVGAGYAMAYAVTAPSATKLTDSVNRTASGTNPSFVGKGGGAHVIHVRAGADCLKNGLNWTDAFDDISSALAAAAADATKTEIWIAGGPFKAGGSLTVPGALAVRGGFDGDENEASERDAGTSTTIDNGSSMSGFTVANAAGTVTFDRIAFCNMTTRALDKTGAGGLVLRDCVFQNNGRSSSLSGAAGRAFRAVGTSASEVVVSNVLFGGNMYMTERNMGYGGAVYLEKFTRATFDACLFASNGDFIAKHPWGDSSDQRGSALYATGCPVTMRDCRFTANCAGTSGQSTYGAGCVRLEGASGGSAFTNCAWVGNTEWLTYTETQDGSGHTKSGALAIGLSSSSGTVDLMNCTFAYNLTPARYSAAALSIACGRVTAKNCIFWRDIHGWTASNGAGTEIAVGSSGYLQLSHSILPDLAVTNVSYAAASCVDIDTDTIYTDDPLFVTPYSSVTPNLTTYSGRTTSTPITHYYAAATKPGIYAALASFDVHLLSSAGYWVNGGGTGPATNVISAAIDKGDPSDDFSREPSPNGSRVNLGCYGNTTKASKTPTGQPTVEEISVVGSDGTTRPEVRVTLGISSGSDYNATVELVCSTGGVELARQTYQGVHVGTVGPWLVPCYVAQGAEVTVSCTVTAEGAVAVSDTKKQNVDGTVPAIVGKGGGRSVVHVRAGADCRKTGADWVDAFDDLTTAATVAATNPAVREIWIATGTYACRATLAVTNAFAIRGGFSGLENAASERKAGTVSTLDHLTSYAGPVIANAADCPLVFERIVFARMSDRGFKKTGAGPLAVRDCAFLACGRSSAGAGRGFWASGSAAADLVVSNCTFRGNMDMVDGNRQCGLGGAVHAETFARATFDACLFETNGLHLNEPHYYGLWGDSAGSALYAKDCPVTARNCRFAGNCTECFGTSSPKGSAGGCVALYGGCGDSAFTNCAWAGNAEWNGHNTVSDCLGGALVVNLSAIAATVTVQNCTFAYNGFYGSSGGALHVNKGTASVRDSIFYGNLALQCYPSASAREIAVRTNGRLVLDHTLVPATNTIYGTASSLSVDWPTVLAADPLFLTDYATMTNRVKYTSAYSAWAYSWNPACYAQLATVNVHVKGTRGHTDETTGRLVRHPGQNSPAVDAGHPASDVSRERADCHGGHGPRVNLGVYGNTPWATRTAAPATLVVF